MLNKKSGGPTATSGARALIRAGFPVVRLKPQSKVPAKKAWQRNAITSLNELKRVLKAHPAANFGVLTGVCLVALDRDGKVGKLALKKLERKYGKLPKTVTVITPGGGRHYYFSYLGADIGNSVGKLGPHIDVRGTGGFVVAAGSVHPCGGVYRYAPGKALGESRIAPLPKWLAKILAKKRPLLKQSPEPLKGEQLNRARRYSVRALALEADRVAKAPLHQRNNSLNIAAFKLGQLIAHGLLDREAVTATLAAAATACGLANERIGPTIKSGLGAGIKSPRRLPAFGGEAPEGEPAGDLSTDLTAELANLGESDTDNAVRFVRRFGTKVLWTPGMGWFVFDGTCWLPDARHMRLKLAIKCAKLVRQEVAFLSGKRERQGRREFAQRSLGKGDLDRMLALAQPDLAVNDEQLDNNPYLLCVANGTLDLRDGVLLPHDPRDLITRKISVRFDPAAKSHQFREFIAQVTGGNKGFARFLKKVAGYTLTGSTKEMVLFFLYGPSKTGKSTLVGLISDLLGPYAVNTPMKTFLVKRFDNEIPVDEARMNGARMVTAIENNVNQQMDEAKIKAMTGGDKQTARFMRQNPFDFKPTFKIWMAANDMPRVRATDDAIWNRFVVLPFNTQLDEEDQDKDLPEKLRGEMEAVLAWAVRGAQLWTKEGLQDKILFEHAKTAWRKQSDTVGRFFQECCQLASPSEKVRASELYGRYQQWCKGVGEKHSSTKAFKASMIQLNVAPIKDRAANWWLGLRLIK